MKKKWSILTAFLLVLVCVIGLAACNDNEGGGGMDPSHTHTWSEWHTEQEPTCTEQGVEKRTCFQDPCNEIEQRSIPALGHNFVNGHCTRCGNADPSWDDTLIEGDVLKNIAVSENGILTWTGLRAASKYELNITINGEEKTYVIDKNNRSVDLKALSDGSKLAFGKNPTELVAYYIDEIMVDGEKIDGEIPLTSDAFQVVVRNSGYSITRLTYADDYVTLSGFYSDVRNDDNLGNYLLYEELVDGTSKMVKLQSKIKAQPDFSYALYKSQYDKDNGNKYTDGYFGIGIPAGGKQTMILDILDSNQAVVKSYNLLIYGIRPLIFNVYEEIRDNNQLTYESLYIPNNSALENDILDINRIYEFVPEGMMLFDQNYNIYRRNTDYNTADILKNSGEMSSSKVFKFYFTDEETVISEAAEVQEYLKIFELERSSDMNNVPGWVLSYKSTAKQKDIIVPSKIIGRNVFVSGFAFSRTDVRSVIFGSGITSLPNQLFDNCNELVSVTIPDTVDLSYARFLFPASRVDYLTIYCEGNPDNGSWNQISGQLKYFRTIKNQAGASSTVTVDNCRIKVEGNVATVVSATGSNLTIPDIVKFGIKEYPVTAIASNALSDAVNVTLGKNIAVLQENCFGSNLVSLSADENNENFIVLDGILYNKVKTEIVWIPAKISGNITIEEGITAISETAFNGCNEITGITIPATVTSIAPSAFDSCAKLLGLTVAQANANYKAINGNLYNKDGSMFLYYAKAKTDTSFALPNSVTEIASEAFSGCRNLTSITIPNSVTKIGESAFRDCSSLESVTLPFIGSMKDGASNAHFGYIFGANSDRENSNYCQ